MSVLEKLPRKGLAPSLDKLEDVVGIRVICLYPKHVDPVVELLTREFKVLEREDKRPEPNPEKFGYSSVHLVCTLSGTKRAKLPEYAGVGQSHFEIQVRTILQEAWAEIEHQLVYKSEVAAPDDVKRQITRVSALLETADKEFQEVYDRREEYAKRLKKADRGTLDKERLNVDSLLEVIRRRYPWAAGWEQIGEPEELGRALAYVLEDLNECGIRNVQQLIPIIDKWNKQVEEESKQLYAGKIVRGKAPYWWEKLPETYHQWARSTRHVFNPLGLIGRCLEKEFHKEFSSRGAE
jgi:ppGpp synthetase/RelA/SpoT-type nucleotidyltranferase